MTVAPPRLPSWAMAQNGDRQLEDQGSSELFQARILIVDDMEANVRLLQRMLASARYPLVDTTVDPRAVYDLHRKNRYDLILLDLDMPRMNGFQVLEGLRALDGDGEVAVVALATQPGERLQALKAGAKDFVTKPFDATEVLTRIANMLEAGMLRHAMKSRRRGLERDLAVAAEIYRALLPTSFPICPGYELAAVSRAADDTSGDVHDIIARPDGRLVMIVADATGHGIGPALSATQLRSMMRMALRLGASLDRIVAEASLQLAADLPSDRFVTAFIGELDPCAHTVEYLAPGQGPLLHWHAASRSPQWLNASGPPFGIAVAPFDHPEPLHLDIGDVVLIATDGIYERANPAGVMFGEVGVEAVMRDAATSTVATIARVLQARADRFAGARAASDDATVILLKRTA
jgi:sigma-B regulation protein RsbU (phosphoserine phosphatase)